MDAILTSFIPMVEFLASVLGEDTEVVLHDMTDINKSVIAIKNGHISGREVGAPATNLALKVLRDSEYRERDFLSNYKSWSADGKPLRSSTFLIRNEQGEIIGMLCVNSSIERYLQLRDILDSFIQFPKEDQQDKPLERFSHSAEELTFDSIDAVISNEGIPPSRIHKEEKLSVVRKLHNSGIFILKGAVSETADRLMISEASVYRYLNQIKKEEMQQ